MGNKDPEIEVRLIEPGRTEYIILQGWVWDQQDFRFSNPDALSVFVRLWFDVLPAAR